jgi:hypothetical protein
MQTVPGWIRHFRIKDRTAQRQLQTLEEILMRLRSMLLLSAISMIWISGVAQAANPPFSITINSNNSTVKAGADVYIKIKMTNTSDHVVDCTKVYTKSGVDLKYHYELRDASGKSVGKRVREHPDFEEAGSFYPCTLNPGQSTGANDSRISSLFDIGKPGKYSLRVWRFGKGSAVVRSNIIDITVTP